MVDRVTVLMGSKVCHQWCVSVRTYFFANPLAYNNSEYCTCDVLDNWLRVIDICRQVSKNQDSHDVGQI